ncbi:MAG TPA: hypothetical protein VE397_17570 [Stellaceae bacterium]|nr:hypothetical protein [Stellaceae bacterium]
MSTVGNIGSLGQITSAAGGIGSSSVNSSGSTTQWFLDYVKETPAQRWEDSWLAAHGLTQQELNSMPVQKRDAILQQMANDLKQQMQQKKQTNASTG